jgi:hypothetical protein
LTGTQINWWLDQANRIAARERAAAEEAMAHRRR